MRKSFYIFLASVILTSSFLIVLIRPNFPSQPSISNVPNLPQLSETANWKTYTDGVNGFSLKYPSTWNKGVQTKTWGNVVILTPESIDKIDFQIQAVFISVQENTQNLSSLGYYIQKIKPGQAGSVCTNPQINSYIPTSLSHLDVTIIEGLCGILSPGPRLIIAHDHKIIDIDPNFVHTIDSNLIYQIFSTFKFTQ